MNGRKEGLLQPNRGCTNIQIYIPLDKECMKTLEEVIVAAAYFLDYHSHYELSRCCQDFFRFIRYYYAINRKLRVNESRELSRFQPKFAAINHVVGDRILISLEELDIDSRSIMDVSMFWATVVMASATTLRTLKICHMVLEAFPNRLKDSNFRNLQTVEIACYGASKYLAVITLCCASTLEYLKMYEHGQVVEGMPAECIMLQKVDLYGKGVSKWFNTIAMGCASTLKVLVIREAPLRRGGGSFVQGMPVTFTVLNRLVLEGINASSWFAVIATGCALTLKELAIADTEFKEDIPVYFNVLQHVDVAGYDASRWFSTVVMGCTFTLQNLNIQDSHRFVEVVSRDFTNLRNVNVEGRNAGRWLAQILKSSASTLQKVRIDDGQIIIWDEVSMMSSFHLTHLEAMLEWVRGSQS
eukprot:GHVU01055327.1.p1 GENE.GHVU01055327.1~~GHVU01055327.1.p1  ORF type:complete len:413 (+),score=26.50 GHVU01055327.1:2838-4076(+)